jgi:hypothetical protein
VQLICDRADRAKSLGNFASPERESLSTRLNHRMYNWAIQYANVLELRSIAVRTGANYLCRWDFLSILVELGVFGRSPCSAGRPARWQGRSGHRASAPLRPELDPERTSEGYRFANKRVPSRLERRLMQNVGRAPSYASVERSAPCDELGPHGKASSNHCAVVASRDLLISSRVALAQILTCADFNKSSVCP